MIFEDGAANPHDDFFCVAGVNEVGRLDDKFEDGFGSDGSGIGGDVFFYSDFGKSLQMG